MYIYGLKRTVQSVFRLACLKSLMTDGVYGSLRHVRLCFLACPSVPAPSRPSRGGRRFTARRWRGPVLVLGETCLGSCREQIRRQGQWLAEVWGRAPCSLPRGSETGANPPALGPAASFLPWEAGWAALGGTSMAGISHLRVGAWIPLLLDTALSFVSLMPWTWPLPDVPRHAASLGKRPGQPGLWSSLQERERCLCPSQGRFGRSRSPQAAEAPGRACR